MKKLNGDKGVAAGIEEEEDELKDFRRGQHNTDSFSGSSRPSGCSAGVFESFFIRNLLENFQKLHFILRPPPLEFGRLSFGFCIETKLIFFIAYSHGRTTRDGTAEGGPGDGQFKGKPPQHNAGGRR